MKAVHFVGGPLNMQQRFVDQYTKWIEYFDIVPASMTPAGAEPSVYGPTYEVQYVGYSIIGNIGLYHGLIPRDKIELESL